MRSSTALTILVVLLVVLAGCSGKKSTPPPPTTSSPPPTSSAPPPTTSSPPPTSSAPPQPKQVLSAKLNWTEVVPGPEKASFSLDKAVKKIFVHTDIICTAQLSTLQPEATQSKANATFYPPAALASLKVKQEYENVGPASVDTACPNKVLRTYENTYPAGEGAWSVQIYGTGNVQARINVTALYT